MAINKYRIKCLTDNKNEDVISNSPPTTCPINAAHSIEINSVACLDKGILVNDGTPKDLTLADYKQLRYNEIDYKTGALIGAGFTYDSQVFSLSLNAQSNWNTLKNSETNFTWPVGLSTIDNNQYLLAQANLSAFWTAGRDAAKGHLDSGRALKKSIFDAVDEAGVDAVVDNR